MYKKLFFVVTAVLLLFSLSVKADLVAHYPFDGDATDASGNGLDGTEVGDPTYEEGYIGQAIRLEDGQYVDCGSDPLFDITEQITLAAWFKINEHVSMGGLVTKGDSSFRVAEQRGAGGFEAAFTGLDVAGTNWGNINFGEGLDDGEWHHIAAVFDGTTLYGYVDGELIDSTGASGTIDTTTANVWIGGNSERAGREWNGWIDDVQIYNNSLTADEILTAMAGMSKGQASKPNPEDEAIEVSIDADLSWKSGETARTHDVYLSTVEEDANDAEVDTPLDALLQAGHDVNSYDLDRLEYGQDYYWRVDEVNGAPDYAIFRGDLWSFTTELLAYPIDSDKIIVTASSSAADQGAENTIDGSGIDPNTNQHSVYSEDMWLSESGDTTPWIQYEFDTVYKLHEMLVWNYNSTYPGNLYGAGDVTIEYSADGDNWETSDVTAFTQASGMADYEAGDTVEFGDVAVKYVKISISNNQADESLAAFFTSAGLSEVSFLAIPAKARFPVPEEATVDVNITSPTLSWTAGRGAVEHNVNFDGVSMATGLTETSYTVPMTLDLSTTYEWSIDEVNGADVWPGSAWSFTTEDYIVVEDFEDYNDTVGFRIYDDAWLDGYEVPSNGALIGHGELPIMEEDEVYAGDQSAPVYFDNTSATFSEVYIDPANLAIGRDFSIGSPQALVLWVYGQDPNAGTEQLYVKVNNTKIVSDVDLTTEDWTVAIFDISGMNLSSVSNLAVGLERTGATGGIGLVYIDEIRLYGSTEALVEEE